MKMVLVPAELLQATVQYLAQRPYREVAQLVPQLMACKEAPEPTPEAVEVDG